MGEIALHSLLQILGYSGPPAPQPVKDLTNDSRLVKPGTVFFAVPGYKTDGHHYILDAVRAGAIAVVAQHHTPGITVPQVIVENSRKSQGLLAAIFFGHPSRELKLVGITGTNGKTTCTFMLEAIFQAIGFKTGLIGTLYNKVRDIILPTANTSPDSILCQRLLRNMVDAGVTHASMEVSSHATVMNRVENIDFSVGAITNFSPDHLDLHGSILQYAQAKKNFFDMLSPKSIAIVNCDDANCLRIAADTAARPLYYSLGKTSADVALAEQQAGGTIAININTDTFPGQPPYLSFPFTIPGRHNVANALVAATVALALGLDATAISTGLGKYKGVFRRFEVIYDGEYRVIDDAAHNPSNLEAVFQALAEDNPVGIAVIYAIRGNRGVFINQAIAATIARWAKLLRLCPLIITSCTDTATPQDAVLPEEKHAFRTTLLSAGIEFVFEDTLRQAVWRGIGSMEPGKTLLLLGAHPMDAVADLFAGLSGMKIVTQPRPPRFQSCPVKRQ